MPPRTSSLPAGRVGRPHGLDGSFHVTRPVAELLARPVLTVAGRRRTVARRAGTAEKPILRLEGSASREDAEALRGLALTIPRDESMLDEDEFWASDVE